MAQITVTLAAKTMEGTGLQDPLVMVELRETFPRTNFLLANFTINNFDGSAPIQFDLEEASFPRWQLIADFSLFDAGPPFRFFPANTPNPTWDVHAARLPNKWAPEFVPLAALASPRFDALTAKIAVSDAVDLKSGENVGGLQAKYDTLSSPAAVLAKAALLNLYAVLIEEVDPEQTAAQGRDIHWFDYVQKIVRLDQERFVAEVDAGLFESVDSILKQLGGKYAGQGYSTELDLDFPLHYPNIPAKYGGNGAKRPVNMVDIITLKKKYLQGDLQLTVSFFRFPDGTTVHLLDCDMDENDNILGHTFDLLRHLLQHSGTSPIFMHEFIEEDSAIGNGGVATIDLGYTLNPTA